MTYRTYGWKPDLPGLEEWLQLPAPKKARPKNVSLSSFMTPCYDQGQLGSCTANGIAGAIEYCRTRTKMTKMMPSRLFIYYNERDLEGTTGSDSGAQIRDGITVVKKYGAPAESDWPYDIHTFTTRPSGKAFTDAAQHLITSAAPVRQTVDDICAAVAAAWPVVFGFTVYESFESKSVASTGLVPMPGTVESAIPLGGHCMLISGYDDDRKLFLCRNSYGPSWGDGGYAWVPYDYLANTDLAADFWQINATAADTSSLQEVSE